MRVMCEGCGKPMPARSGGAGRPAAYHGATCRQRARRARLAVEPDRAALLAGLADVEHALTAARRAVIAGQDPRAALEQLTATVTSLTTSDGSSPQPDPQPATVTKPVTVLAAGTTTVDPDQPRPVTPADKVDLDTVHVVRSPDFEFSGSYQALATVRGATVLVGILRRSGRAWAALNPLRITVSGGPWRTRQEALIQLLLNHDLTRCNARRTRPKH